MRIFHSHCFALLLFCSPLLLSAQSLFEQAENDYHEMARTGAITMPGLPKAQALEQIEALKNETLTAAVAYQLGILHMHTQQLPETVMYFEQMADLAETDEMQRTARLFVAKLHGIMQNEDAALAQIAMAKKQWPNDPVVYLHEGEVYRKMKQWENAKAAFAKGMAMAKADYLTPEQLTSYHFSYALAIGHTDGKTAGVAYSQEHVKPYSERFHKYILHKLGVSEKEAAHTKANTAKNTASAQVFPNPATDQLKLSWIIGETFSYSVMNTQGQMVMAGRTSSTAEEVDVSRLAPGVYQVVLKSASTQQALQFVKE